MPATSTEDTERPVRDRLALVRTRLANERTLLAYSRTALILIATGVTLLKLYGDSMGAVILAWILMSAGMALALLGGWRFRRTTRSLE